MKLIQNVVDKFRRLLQMVRLRDKKKFTLLLSSMPLNTFRRDYGNSALFSTSVVGEE